MLSCNKKRVYKLDIQVFFTRGHFTDFILIKKKFSELRVVTKPIL